MCGIVGFTGRENALPILIKGLYSLEYRGYDSAGVAAFTKDGLRVVKARGRIANLEEKIKEEGGDMYCTCGIGHTRWATHGEPSDRNSHPHLGGKGKVAVVHNGIIENYKELRERLLAMKPGEFEELISQLLAEMGFEMVEVTKLSGDGGIDVRGTLVVGDVVRIKMAVQVKKWKLKNNILAPVVQQVRGSLGAHEQGLIITTSDFSAGAIKEAAQPDKTPIALMNGEQLVMLLMEHGIGVHRSTPDLFEIDEEFAMGGSTS